MGSAGRSLELLLTSLVASLILMLQRQKGRKIIKNNVGNYSIMSYLSDTTIIPKNREKKSSPFGSEFL